MFVPEHLLFLSKAEPFQRSFHSEFIREKVFNKVPVSLSRLELSGRLQPV